MARPNREAIQQFFRYPLSNRLQLLTLAVRHFKKNSLRFSVYHGSQRLKKDAALLRSFHVVLTTYDTLRAEHVRHDEPEKGGSGVIQSIIWHRVVLDEGKSHPSQHR